MFESDLQRSMQSVNIRVPGLESSMSSGEVNTLPVTNSKWTVSVADGQKLACAIIEGTSTSIRKEEIIFNIGIGEYTQVLSALGHAMGVELNPRPSSQSSTEDQLQGCFGACGWWGGWCATGAGCVLADRATSGNGTRAPAA